MFADRHAGASEEEKKEHEKKFKEVGEAYGVLSDTKKRTRYDQGHDVDDLEGHGHGFGADIDPNQIFQVIYFLKKQDLFVTCKHMDYSPWSQACAIQKFLLWFSIEVIIFC